MEPEASSPTSRRKLKFAPKAPARKTLKTTPLKIELSDEDDKVASSEAQTLLRQFNENLTRRAPKSEKKTQVAFGAGATSSSRIRSFGVSKEERASKSNKGRGKSLDDDQIPKPLPLSIAEKFESLEDLPDASTAISEKAYSERWDYDRSYYPTVLPLWRPHSGDPEILDAAEFGEADKVYDEKSINSASKLGLMEENKEGKMLLFQLPSTLPIVKRPASAKGKEKFGSSSSSDNSSALTKRGKLEELPGGYVGKMLVYNSGSVKLKLGNILYDVSPGSDVVCAQDVMAIHTAKKQCCNLGELGKRAVVVPDINHLLMNSVVDLG